MCIIPCRSYREKGSIINNGVHIKKNKNKNVTKGAQNLTLS